MNLNFKKTALVLLVLTTMFSCLEEKTNASTEMVCSKKNVFEDLLWLKNLKLDLESESQKSGSQIIQYDYLGSQVFVANTCAECTNSLNTVFDCKGDTLCQFDETTESNTCPDFFEMASNRQDLLVISSNSQIDYGVFSYSGPIAADGCDWIFQTSDKVYSIPIPIQGLPENTLNQVSFFPTGDTLFCGFSSSGIPQININNFSDAQEVYINNRAFDQVSSADFNISAISIVGNTLTVEYSASGCDGNTWELRLIDRETIAESLPPQRTMKFVLYNPELCQTVITAEKSFDISSLQVDNGKSVLLNIEGFDEIIEYLY